MNILGIETSCDETAAAVVRDGHTVLSNVVYTQIPLHVPYGGVVPEIASRAHVEKIGEVVREAIRQFEQREDQSPSEVRRTSEDGGLRHHIDAVAVTYGPGLSPALIVGLNAAKGLARSLGVPLIGINHIEAHLHTPFLVDAGDVVSRFSADATSASLPVADATSASLPCPSHCVPALGLAVSGGNTIWIDMPEYGRYEVIGETLDDAAGEAFDKAAKLLGLGYPGGLKIDRISAAYLDFVARSSADNLGGSRLSRPGTKTNEFDRPADATSASLPSHSSSLPSHSSSLPSHPSSLIPFPKGRPRDGVTALAGLPAEFCVSFSGLKTALLRHVQQHPELLSDSSDARDFGGYTVTPALARVVASYQEAIAQALADRTRAALARGKGRYKSLVLGGGVSLNSRIRAVLTEVCAAAGVTLLMAKPKYTGDNGAMIAGLAYYRRNHVEDAFSLDVNPCLEVGA